jgi:hypothetical protein
MESQISVPVLLICFNRPDTTQVVFDKIRAARPEKLYVAVDGPRAHKVGEDLLVEKVKAIVNQVDWPCETHYKFNPTNYGCAVTVSSSIHWVFETEEYAIILEDDIVAPLAFFRFAQEMLFRYKDDERIGIISGNNFTPIPLQDDSDYFFAKYGHSWGWATWKRFWDSFDLNIEVNEKHLSMDFLNTISNSREEALFYKKRFRMMKKRGAGNNIWDVVANYVSRINNRMNIIPRVNLTSNIGTYGLHARGETIFHNVPYDESFVVKSHPREIVMNTEYDKHHFKEHFLKHKKSLHQRILNKIYLTFTGTKIYK